jgi:putative addiction module CopG family antidote
MSTASLHVSLPDTLEEFVLRRVEEGGFSDPSDYVRALIRADRERAARRAALLDDLDVGLRDLAEGRVVEGEEVFAELRRQHPETA